MLSAQRVWEKISINFFPLPSVLQCGNTKNRGDITLRKLSLFSSSPESQKHRAAEIFGISKTGEKNLWRQAVTQPLYIPIVSMHKLLCKSVFSHHVVFPLPNIACTELKVWWEINLSQQLDDSIKTGHEMHATFLESFKATELIICKRCMYWVVFICWIMLDAIGCTL